MTTKRTKTAREVVNSAISMVGELDEDEVLTVVTEIFSEPVGLGFDNAAITTDDERIDNKLVPAGKAATFRTTGGSRGDKYRIGALCSTSKGQVREGVGFLEIT